MFLRSYELFKAFGIPIRIDLSWTILALLITWSLAERLFPELAPDQQRATYWVMGAVGALGLFVSIVLHELGHALTARRYEMPIRGITLFIFGGVAEMTREPPTAKAEFLVAIAGPIVSVVLGIGFSALYVIGQGWPAAATAVLGWLGLINLILVGFNAIPAFPLDGGRVLRSALWALKGDLRWATRITSAIGSAFGLVLVFLGVFILFGGDLIGGLWLGLIGMFLRAAANASYQHLLLRQYLEGEPVSRFMTADVKTVPPEATVRELVEDYIYRHHFKMLPVTDNGRVTGCVTTRQVREIPRDDWERQTVREIAEPCTERNTVAPDADALQALTKMERNQLSRLMVVEDGELRGVFSFRDVMGYMAARLELEEE